MRTVSRERIIDELWGERPPATVAAALNVYVSKLRKILAAAGAHDVLMTQEPGYVLRVQAGQLDAERFGELAAAGRHALEAGDQNEAFAKLAEALSLWRGDALDDLAEEEFARTASARLEEARLAALTDRIEAELARGHATELVGQLEGLVSEHPFQERLWAELMLALYRSGRQADALDAYRRAREQLDELGIEPSPELKQLQAQILRQDPALQVSLKQLRDAAHPELVRHPSPWKRKRVLALAAAVLLAGAAAALAIALTSSSGTPAAAPAPNSVRAFDLKTHKSLASIPIGGTPGGLAMDDNAVWVANEDDGTVLGIDPKTTKIVQTIGVSPVAAISAGAGAVWAVSGYGTEIVRIPPRAPDLATTTSISPLPNPGDPAEVQQVIAFGAGSVWTLNGLSGVTRMSPDGQIVRRIDLHGAAPDQIAFGAGSLWIADGTNRQLLRIDPGTNKVAQRVIFGESPSAAAIGYDSVWVADYLADVVWKVNPILGRVERSIAVGERPIAVAVGDGAFGSPAATTRPLRKSIRRQIA
jgi:DNA-binding SARP family transcriptional activator